MLLKSNFCSQLCCTLSLTDRRFLVMTGHVMEPDAVVVEVVEDGEAGLVPLPVVGLLAAGPVEGEAMQEERTHPPVLDQFTLLYLLPLGHRMDLPLTWPPVQKYFCRSSPTSPRNSRSLAPLSIEIGRIPFSRQKRSAPPWLKEEQPILQDTR